MQQSDTLSSGSLFPAEEAQVTRRSNLWVDAFHRLLRNKLAVIGLAMVIFLVFLTLFGPYLPGLKERDVPDFANKQVPPNREFLLGTDLAGRDMLTRLIWGARVSITVGLFTQVIIVVIGVTIGALAGYYGGTTDNLLMRFVDIIYAFPTLLFVILIMTVRGRGLLNIFIAIGLVGWVTLARLVRAQLLSLREKEFIKAARVSGTGGFGLITRHLLPNALTPIIVAVTFGIPTAIFTEATLSFFGVGISPPTPSWGQMVGEYQVYLQSSPHMAILPAACIAFTMLAFTFLGDGLRDALDPKMNR